MLLVLPSEINKNHVIIINIKPIMPELALRSFLYILRFNNKSKSIINHINIEKYVNSKTIECV